MIDRETSIKRLVEQAQDVIGQLGSRFSDTRDKVMQESKSLLSSTRSLIREYPLLTIASAFGIGYLMVRLFRR